MEIKGEILQVGSSAFSGAAGPVVQIILFEIFDWENSDSNISKGQQRLVHAWGMIVAYVNLKWSPQILCL